MSIALSFELPRDGFSLDVGLRLPDKGVTAVYGASGSGKTTLLRCIAGLEIAYGSCRVGHSVWQDDDAEIFMPPHRRRVGYVFQQAALFAHLTVRGNLQFAMQRAKGEHSHFDDVVEAAGVGHLLSRSIHGLSGGEAQRVALARALLSDPQLLLLDEPLAALDRAGKQQLLPVLERLARELAIPLIYVTHSIQEVARLADTIVFLEQGAVVRQGPVGEMLMFLDRQTGSDDVVSLIMATVVDYDAEFQLNTLQFAGGRLLLPGEGLPTGAQVRIAVAARDVSVTLAPAGQTSILNIIPTTVMAVDNSAAAQVDVQLRAGDTALLARITRKSAHALDLRPGLPVFAQIKSASLVE